MSPYSITLAQARLQALHALQCTLLEAKTPDELRRCAVAILNAPDPCEIDDALPLHAPGMSESLGGASESRGCSATNTPPFTSSPATSPSPQTAQRAIGGCQPQQPLGSAPQTSVGDEIDARFPEVNCLQPQGSDSPAALPHDLSPHSSANLATTRAPPP